MNIPHSRGNDLAERDLKAAGYRILTRAPVAGVDMFARQEGSFHLFFQGHPEYEPATLLREYRRDIGRFLRGERDTIRPRRRAISIPRRRHGPRHSASARLPSGTAT